GEPIHDLHDFRRRQSELRAIAGRVLPAADALRGQLGANPEGGHDAQLLRGSKDHGELLDPLEHDEDGLVEALGEESRLMYFSSLYPLQRMSPPLSCAVASAMRSSGLLPASSPKLQGAPNSTTSSTTCLCWLTLTG